MAMEVIARNEISAGQEIEMINKPYDAESVLIEGLGGLAFSEGIVKLNLFQQYFDPAKPGQIAGAFKIVLNIPTAQFLQIEAVLHQVAADITSGAPVKTESE